MDSSKEETKHFKVRKEGYNFSKNDYGSVNSVNSNVNNNNANIQVKRDDTELEEALNEV